jgi:hypothetical protein
VTVLQPSVGQQDLWNRFRRLISRQTSGDKSDMPWLRITLPEFTLLETQDVVFDMQDIECGFWKQGIIFDFIELRKCT